MLNLIQKFGKIGLKLWIFEFRLFLIIYGFLCLSVKSFLVIFLIKFEIFLKIFIFELNYFCEINLKKVHLKIWTGNPE